MLIVLLDEMNLARVEYYFSEFLSRLEIRRGVKSAIAKMKDEFEIAQTRRAAEIPLEVGGAGGSDSMLYLFTDTNVLFVGTMNEDETTQTLSDKVVDRANVLRFGRPMSLKRGPVAQGPVPIRKYLPYEVWQRWVRPESELAGEESDRVDIWIDKLNTIMTDIRRPFAFRTHLAMRTYIANYPRDGLGDRATALAMADQVEQKIMPKFRGLDPNDGTVSRALDDLVRLLSELNDRQLVDAIQQVRANSAHLFAWQGVDRFSEVTD